MFRSNQMGVYIHWPFCKKRCPYCDFNAHVREEVDQKVWADAYCKAIKHYAEKLPDKQVVSVFFGGGTPSLMEPETVSAMINTIQSSWSIANDVEITLEANPTSVEIEKFKAFREAGVNRISMGIQSFHDHDLQFLGREHSAKEAKHAIEIAAQTFDRYSFDLMYGRPDQALTDWQKELEEAIPFADGHISLYQLTIERNTPFYMRHARGEFEIPDDVKGAEFYNLTQDVLENHGLPAYEVSNHASPGQECKHNLIYWHMADYIGVGAGAHGRFRAGDQKYATRDHAAPEIWLNRVNTHGHGAHPYETLSNEDIFHEALMMGLRLKSGVAIDHIEQQSSLSFDKIIDENKLKKLKKQDWLIQSGSNIKLTREGLLRLNAIVSYLLV
ncbi:MAG: coproporphyrinogen III oxidase [Alphaproteobacteria bacterium]|nr:coproporphyrinogen III oxidase [Alphaproteobacteria bacterium]